MDAERQRRVERALFRGGALRLGNRVYRRTVRRLTDALLQDDLAGVDLTFAAMKMRRRRVCAEVVAREAGVVAGLEEFAYLYGRHGVKVVLEQRDGDTIRPGDVVLRAEGSQATLLALERIGLNIVQRMSGIASASRCLQERVDRSGWPARVVGTRKTPWGLLDKRALHLGNGGTHRLGLSDAILIKNNHLALFGGSEEEAVRQGVERAWTRRGKSAFIEVEVRSAAGARAAGQMFRRQREGALEEAGEDYPCIVMLDNMSAGEAGAIVHMLREEGLWDHALVEASGGISHANLLEYAACGVDAISIGELTHSARALDLSQRIQSFSRN
jgi:nicotinate-nucleotide pyrophosphorylase (carboxylating)